MNSYTNLFTASKHQPVARLPRSLRISLGNGVAIEGLSALSVKELGELVRILAPAQIGRAHV